MTVSEDQVRRVWVDPHLTRKEAAASLGISVNALTKRARKQGLPMREQVDKRADKMIVTDDRVRELWGRDDLSRAEQARLAGIAVNSLRERARKLGLSMRAESSDRRIPASRIREVWMDPELTGQQAADLVGLTRANLWLRAKSMGLPPRKQGTRFSIAGEAPRALFIAMWEAPVAANDIAEHFSINVQTVSAYARRLDLSKRTHPSRLIGLTAFWERRREQRMVEAMRRAADEAAIAQRRFAREDYDADPAGPDPARQRRGVERRAISA